MFRTTKFSSRGVALLLLSAGWMNPAGLHAQGVPSDPVLGEIIVTAQKRSENLQNVPMSITAVTGAGLEASGAQTISDIMRFVPGLAVANTGPGQSEVIVRGISSGIALSILGNVATVGYYLDETPVSDLSRNLDAALVDLERVEVLRGPQGTLYGSSSMGGTIRYISHKPDLFQSTGKIGFDVSHTDHSGQLNKQVEGVLNVPLVNGKLAARLAGFYQDWTGYIDRYSINPADYHLIDPAVAVQKNANSSRLGGARLTFRFQPNEYVEIVPSVLYQKTLVDAPFTVDKPPGSLDNLVQVRFVTEHSSDLVKLANLTAIIKVPAFEIVSATSYYDRVPDSIEDWSKLAAFVLAEAPFPFYQFSRFSQKSWTEEIRLSKSWERMHGVIGLYYQSRNNGLITDDPVYPGYNQKFGTNIDTFFFSDETTRTKERAAFAEVNINVTSALTLTLGVRKSKTEQTHQSVSDGYFNGGHSEDFKSTSSDSTTPKFGLSYQFTPDVLAYATVAKGARPGGSQHFVPVPFCTPYLNQLGLTQAPVGYSPDSLWSYEVGTKNRFENGRLIVNASAFFIDWSQIQQEINLACGFPIITNFGRAQSKGAELAANWRLAQDWTVSGNAAFTDATARSEVVGIPVQKGDPLLNTPRWAYGLAADYSHPITSTLELTGRLDGSYTGWTAAIFDKASPFYKRPSYTLLNFNVGVRNVSNHWRASLFVDNATNRHAETGRYFSNTGNSEFPPDIRSLGVNRPRTIGLRAAFDFQ